MTGPFATAYVEIRGDTSKVGSDVVSGVQKEMGKSGKAITDAVAKPITEAGKTTTSVFSGVGQSISNAMKPAIQQVNNFTSGFKDADAARSAFSGRMGSLGGVVRSALDPAIQGVTNFRAGLESSQAAASAFTGRMGTLGGAVSTTFRQGGLLARDFGNVGSQVATRVGTGFSTAATQIQGKFTNAFSMIKSSALGVGAVLGAGGIGALIGAGFTRLSDIEQTTKSLEVMTGSASKAKSVMNDLLTFAKSTPFAFPDISEIGRNMVSFGIDTSQVVPILRSLGDAASASGQGVEAIHSLGDAMGSIAIQGKVSGQEIQSFQAVGVPALKILANAAGISAADMSKRISKGTVDSKFAIDALVKGIETGTTGIAGSTAKMGGIMASQKDTIAGTLDSFKSSISSTMAGLIEPYIPAFRTSVNAIGNGFKQIPVLLAQAKQLLSSSGFFDALRNIFTGIGSVIASVWPLIQGFVKGFATTFGAGILVGLRALGAAFQWLGGILRSWGPVLQPIVTAFGVLWGATAILRTVMLAGGAAMLIWKGIMIAFGPVIKIFTALQWALNIALDANPISLIILAIIALVAGFVILWNKSAAFRLFWINLWKSISTFFVGVWNTMKDVFNTVIDALTTAWNATWKFISDVISAVWNGFLKPVFDAIGTAITAIGDAARWLWNTILQPVFNFIGAAAVIMGKIVLGLVLIPLVAFFKLILAPVALWLWHNVIEPTWEGISLAISIAWTKVIKPTIDLLVNIFSVILPNAALWLWHNVIEPVWNGIANTITFVWIALIKPKLDAIINFFTVTIPNAALWLWHNAIEPVWKGISATITFVWIALIKPKLDALINFFTVVIPNAANWLWHNIIEPVFRGIGNIIKFVWDTIISPAFEAIKSGLRKVGDVFGAVKDTVRTIWDQLGEIAMKPIRFVVNTVLDDGLIRGWNTVVDFLKLGFLHIPPIPRLATGGIIPGYTPGRDTHVIGVGGGEAVMRPEWTRAAGAGYVNAANYAARTGGVGGAASFIARNGLPTFASGGIFDIPNPFFSPGAGLAVGLGVDFLLDPVNNTRKLLEGIAGGLNGGALGDVGRFLDIAMKLPGPLIDGMVKKIQDWWTQYTATTSLGTATASGGNQAIVQSIFASMFGWGSPAEWAATVQLLMHESGFNNTAQNPTSTAYGMFQFLDSTWAGYGIPKTANPVQQAVAGGRYIQSRYHDPIGAWAFWAAHHWYNRGGIPTFDTGGWMQPGSFGYNASSSPEAVLNGSQWKSITQSLDMTNAARELLKQITSGGSFFEDFSFYGYSENLRANNDLLADLYYRNGGQFEVAGITQFLTSITSSSSNTTRAAAVATTSVHAMQASLDDKLDEMIDLLRQRSVVGVTVNLDGKIIEKYFQEAEIMGGL